MNKDQWKIEYIASPTSVDGFIMVLRGKKIVKIRINTKDSIEVILKMVESVLNKIDNK